MNLSISSNDIAILHTETTPRCTGYIIFEDATCQRVILVKTHKGNYSFPKGKREKKFRKRLWEQLNLWIGSSGKVLSN